MAKFGQLLPLWLDGEGSGREGGLATGSPLLQSSKESQGQDFRSATPLRAMVCSARRRLRIPVVVIIIIATSTTIGQPLRLSNNFISGALTTPDIVGSVALRLLPGKVGVAARLQGEHRKSRRKGDVKPIIATRPSSKVPP